MSLLSQVRTTAPSRPSRLYLYAQEKWGKTSFAAYAPKPIFVMTEGETGLLSLIEAGRVPEVPHFPEDARSWTKLFDIVEAVLKEDHQYKTLILDTANGAERLLSQHVLEHDFGGVMTGKDGYSSYGKGDLACIPKWTEFLRLLDDIRIGRGMGIILLAHSKIKSVNNPEGSDYDQLRPEGNDKLWPLTHKWADVIACGTHEVFVKDDKAKETKGRQLRTSGSVAVVAGNRYGLPEKISCGPTAKSAWTAFANEMMKAKAAGKKTEKEPAANNPPAKEPEKTPPAEDVRNSAPVHEPPPAAKPPTEDSFEVPTGDDLPPETEAPIPSSKIPEAVARTLVEEMNAVEVTWPNLRQKLPECFGVAPAREIYVLTDLTLDEAEKVRSWLKTQKKPSKKKAGAA